MSVPTANQHDPVPDAMPGSRVVSPGDPAIRYVGRWAAEGAGKRGNWIRPYFKLTFSGSTAIAIHLLERTDLAVVIDGHRHELRAAAGLVTLGCGLAPTGPHVLTVSGLTGQDSVFFDRLHLDRDAVLHQSSRRMDHIEFIGDSITACENSCSRLVAQALGTESSCIAYPGMALRDGFGYYRTTPPLFGMESAYFKNSPPERGTAGDWNFAESPYRPDLIVVNLGTNDFAAIQGEPALIARFREAFATLLQGLRTRFPAAQMFVLRPFTISAEAVQTAIQEATWARIEAGDLRIHYVDTSSWDVEIIPGDGIHPTGVGHVAIADQLVSLLRPFLKAGVAS